MNYADFLNLIGTIPIYDDNGVLRGLECDGCYTEINYIHTDSDLNPIEEKKAVVGVERVRRITGYLTGDTSKWGSSKQAELKDRVKHT